MRILSAALAAALLSGALLAGAAAAEPVSVAVFDFELIDTSLEGEMNGPRADEARRLAALGAALRSAYAEAPGYAVVDIAPVRDRAAAQDLQNCGGCATTLAAEVGADLTVTGTVQKVSNLILNINLYLEGPDGRRVHSADIRSNTDESWARGLDWLIRNRLEL